MSEHIYDWKRFWSPRSDQLNLFNGGSLSYPGWGDTNNPDSVTLEEISDFPCLVLLGEAGMGKTTVLKQEYERLEDLLKNSPHKCLWRSLGDYTSKSELCEDIFEHQIFQDWLQGNYRLYLFLDSLDEGLLTVKRLVRILKLQIEKLPSERLYFRITCRAADWKDSLEQKLQEKWGKDKVGIYKLIPLRHEDIIEASSKNGIDSDKILEEVRNKNAIPLAIKPITLKFLLDIYGKDGGLPTSQKDLYEQGCLQLCEEINPDRYEAGFVGKLDAKPRLVVAARIAFLTLFSNRAAVRDSREYGQVTVFEIPIQDLSGGRESLEQQELSVDEACIKEVLSITGLFTPGKKHQMVWAHQTYAEFLAAWYLKHHQFNPPQILNLIMHPDHRVIPQLRGTTAWLCSMMPELFREVRKTDPDVLLQGDIATFTETDKATLVESLLKAYDEKKLSYSLQVGLYKELNHSKLASQLQAYICDSNKREISRWIAIDIARDCNLQAVQSDLVKIALEPSQPYQVRVFAARSICQIGDEETKAKLKPLVLGEAGDDPDDSLKGYSLKAVWSKQSKHLTIEELLNSLSQPKTRGDRSTFYGAYQDFILIELAQSLQLSDLPKMLKWLDKKLARQELYYPFDGLSDTVILKAWKSLEEPEILQAFASLAFQRLKKYQPLVYNESNLLLLKQELESNNHKRRQLIEAIFSRMPDSKPELFILLGDSKYGFIKSWDEDFPWLIEHLQSSDSEHIQKMYAKLIRWNLDWDSSNQLSTIIKASQDNPILKLEFASDLEPIELNSLRAEQAKTSYLEWQNWPKPPEQKPLLDPPLKQRVLTALEQVESGQPELWWQVCMAMQLTPTSTHWHFPDQPNLAKLPGWQEAEADTKARIIKAAKVYLDVGQPETQTWRENNTFRNNAFTGYQALYLLQQQESEFISTLPTSTWIKWIPAILKSISLTSRYIEQQEQPCREIVRTAYHSASEEFIEMLIVLMHQYNYQPCIFYVDDVYRLTNNLLDQPLAKLIFDKVKDENLQAGMLEILLRDIFSDDVDEAKKIARSFIPTSIPSFGEIRDKAVVAARLLLLHADNYNWSVLWSAIQQDSRFGREVLEPRAFPATCKSKIEHNLQEEYLADLYIFLAQQYPKIEESKQETKELSAIKAAILDKTYEVGNWKDYILQHLQERGTPEACEALQKIIIEPPEQKELIQWRLVPTLSRKKD
ncbi:MAG: hypothetical protein F6J89_04310 [Symploca sp. SIO1C4]|uniref:NACHT domain-containing protein n=1 Tax=Symploca sp. SIO1C4 TaxID=2607765 RepID=A0A6B3N5M0_9CYAN|nr:hypothetical protein [Symploca sp. SIO1C4]